MTPFDIARRTASTHNQFGERNWALYQSGREAECESLEHLCTRVLGGLREVDPATAFEGLLLVFTTQELAMNQLLAAELLLRGRFRSTVAVADFLDGVLRFADPITTDSVAAYMAWAFGQAEALAAVRARQAADSKNWYYLGFVEYALASHGQEEP
jgi:hypothetical protein